MNIGIVGLGLIGGSIAKAIKYNTDNSVFGTDIVKSVVLKAKLLGAIDKELTSDMLSECDMLIVALYPQASVDYITQNASLIKKGSLVIDTCGIKGAICQELFDTADANGFTFIGAHPMAGLHFSGFDYSQPNMFDNASMILVPPKNVDIALLEQLKNLFSKIGFTVIKTTTAQDHDKKIAYTSQLAHVVSNAYVKSPEAEVHSGFSAGSYQDLTRVAKLNPAMWTELFLCNKENLAAEIDGLIENLKKYSEAIKTSDEKTLYELLKEGSDRKEKIDGVKHK